jgi:hypothetical protein
MIVTNEPTGIAQHSLLLFSGVGRETLTHSAVVPTHPMATGLASTDHSEPNARGLEIDAWIATSLNDDVIDLGEAVSGELFTAGDGDVYLEVVPSSEQSMPLQERVDQVEGLLTRIIGMACTIYTVRHGILGPFALASYSSGSEVAGKVNYTLSFQEIRVAQGVDQVIVPALPRAAMQETPRSAEQDVDNIGKDMGVGPSIAARIFLPENNSVLPGGKIVGERRTNYLSRFSADGDVDDNVLRLKPTIRILSTAASIVAGTF